MTGGRAYLYDPDGRHLAALDPRSVHATRLSTATATRDDGAELVAELRELLEAHREAGSALAARLLAERATLESDIWLVEPLPIAAPSSAPDDRPAPIAVTIGTGVVDPRPSVPAA
jgi:glutamate synthase domain-containing protein 3